MAITSVGYERAINYAQLGELLEHAGAQYSVFGAGSFALSAGPSDREVRIASGRAYGRGILDESDATESLIGAPVASGSRWDLIALRRQWAAKTTTPVLIPGGSTDTIPNRSEGLGVTDDQPLGLVRFAAGQSAVQEFIDLRVWHANGGCWANHRRVLDYMNTIGSRIYVVDRTYVRGINSQGNAYWTTDSVIFSTTQPSPADVPWLQVP